MTHVTIEGNNTAVQTQNPHTLLTNDRGDYLALGCPNHSNYDGLFVKTASGSGSGYVKVLSNIVPKDERLEPGTLHLGRNSVRRNFVTGYQEIALNNEGLRMQAEGNFTVTLDCKRLYDESDVGRIYEVRISKEVDGATSAEVRYTKYEDAQNSRVAYNINAFIMTDMGATESSSWHEASYAYDDRRGTKNTRWVCDALALSGKGVLCMSVADTMQEARDKAFQLFKNKKTPLVESSPSLPANAMLAWRSLASLRTRTGIMAGLPWFFQEWSRDELISTGGVLAAKQYGAVVAIVDKWLAAVGRDGSLPAIYPDQGLRSVDAPGWLGKRIRDLLVRLSDEGIMHKLPTSTINRWREGTGTMIDGYAQHLRDGLIWNEQNTTWMDTQRDDDGRAGARIEIQALFLALCDAHSYLCTLTKTAVAPQRQKFAKVVVDGVHNRLICAKPSRLLDGLHADGTQDTVVRPNIFLAWYIAPKLFSSEQWEEFFSASLPELWLAWGGLSSIGRHDRNYHGTYTGEDVASYHRGDSWYFINNIAAMAMHAVNPGRFQAEIKQILQASKTDLLSQGYIGHCSEISSADRQEAAGCHAQAWSASTLLEALLKIENG